MKTLLYIILVLMMISINSCKKSEETSKMKIIFLHHSTGAVIWRGGKNSFMYRVADKISPGIADFLDKQASFPKLFKQYNKEHVTNYFIKEMEFPKEKPYGWKNYPFDYYNIWVKNAGEKPFMDEPTLEILTKDYQVIVLKHCFPGSNIKSDPDSTNINSERKTLANYKLQYLALRDKFHEFQEIKFIVFTGAAQVRNNIKEEDARRAREFNKWVTEEWDLPDDNIYIWDLNSLQTEGDLYFKDVYSVSANNSHPNKLFAEKVAMLLFNRMIDIVENNGNGTNLRGEKK